MNLFYIYYAFYSIYIENVYVVWLNGNIELLKTLFSFTDIFVPVYTGIDLKSKYK